MSKHMHDQAGFIPMMLAILLIVVAILYFVFEQVAKAQH